MRKTIAIAALVAVASAAIVALLYKPSQGPRAVFLIVVDTLRPDRLSCYGYQPHRTPNIDRLAERGVLFTNAQATASWTVPSMGSIMTSLYPSHLGLLEVPAEPGQHFEYREERVQLNYTLPEEAQTLTETLADHGFRTAAFVNQHALNAHRSFVQGVDDWYFPVAGGEIHHLGRGEFPTASDSDSSHHRSVWKNQEENDSRLVDEMERWLGSNSRRRIFVWLHLLSPHRPYEAPRRFRAPGGRDPSSLYDAEVRYVDELIGRVIRMIDSSVGLEHSLLVFTSDHGEEFGEHGMEEHGHSLHSEVTWVPLIIAGGVVPPGLTVDARVSGIDIMPTLLEAIGAESSASDGLVGSSLLPVMAGDADARDAYMEGMLYGSTERALIADGYKLMLDEQGVNYRLYHTESDPSETKDLADRQPERAGELRLRLEEMHARFEADRSVRFPALGHSLVTDEERERIRRAMRALGYINE